MTHYYNEFNAESAAMLQQFMDDGLIPYGDIDTRSIHDVTPSDVAHYTQCHFFAGIAGWQFALQLAEWPNDKPVWTGSCPCQPFSPAGRQKGKADDRHLWPVWLRLIEECRPPTIFGEQVSNAIGKENKEMSNMLKRIGVVELLLAESERQNILSTRLQILRNKEESTASQRYDRAEPFDSDEMAGEIKRLNTLLECEEESQGYESTFQPYTRMDSRKDRQGSLPTNQHTFQPSRGQDVGQSINRQGRPEERLCEKQLSGGTIFSKRDDAQLGREQSYRNSSFYYGDKTEEIRGFAEQIRAEFEKATTEGWLDDVYKGLEAQDYAVGAVVLPASSVGAPHKRDRLWFVAHTTDSDDRGNTREFQGADEWKTSQRQEGRSAEFSSASNVADTECQGLQRHRQFEQEPNTQGWEAAQRHPWSSGVWIVCPDGKQRLVEPSIPLLVDGFQHRKPILHALGNAIVPQVAAEFIKASM